VSYKNDAEVYTFASIPRTSAETTQIELLSRSAFLLSEASSVGKME